MEQKFDIYKAGGIIIRDKKLLVEKSKNKDFFISPGGSIEAGETPQQALARELKEEFRIEVREEDLRPFGTFYAEGAGQEKLVIRMDVFIVDAYQGEPTADNEVEEIRWINTTTAKEVPVGSIFEHDVIPKLKESGLID